MSTKPFAPATVASGSPREFELPIEMRSDTFTLPTPAMLNAMVHATLGDDVYGEDPTVRELEGVAARLVGKTAAVFMPSGTMANLSALLTHVPRGGSTIVGDESDIYLYEARGASVLGGIAYEPVGTAADGSLPLNLLDAAFPGEPEDPQFVLPALICLESTHNRAGGVPLSAGYLASVRALADRRDVKVHLDGARLMNAALGLGIEPQVFCDSVDSVQFCISKGLRAPVGSVLAGTEDFVGQARRWRKMLGGGMRQAGLLAAAGLVALRDHDHLRADHEHAVLLAEALARIPGVQVTNSPPRTNIVLFRVDQAGLTPTAFVEAAERSGLRVGEFGHGRVRAVLHDGVRREDVERAVLVVAQILSAGSGVGSQ